MNRNSFQIKGWMITITAALLAIFASTKNAYFILTAIFPVAVFWFLDAYYLSQERKYRALYNDVAGVSKEPKQVQLFDLDASSYEKWKYGCVFFSKTIGTLYLIVIIALAALYLNFSN